MIPTTSEKQIQTVPSYKEWGKNLGKDALEIWDLVPERAKARFAEINTREIVPEDIFDVFNPKAATPERNLNDPQKIQQEKKRYKERKEFLDRLPPLNDLIRQQYAEQGMEIPDEYKDQDLGFVAVEKFRKHAKSAIAARRWFEAIKKAEKEKLKDAQDAENAMQIKNTFLEEKKEAARLYLLDQAELAELYEYGPGLEKAYRKYLWQATNFARYKSLSSELSRLRRDLYKSNITTPIVGSDEVITQKTYAQMAAVQKGLTSEASPNQPGKELVISDTEAAILEALVEDPVDRAELLKELEKKPDKNVPKTGAEIQKRIKKVEEEIQDLWGYPHVRKLYRDNQLREYSQAIARGDEVLETPSTISLLNKIYRFEQNHPNDVFGCMLVGAPGVGKTTALRHYLRSQGREFTYIDMSDELTIYTLFGSKSVEFTRRGDYLKKLREDIEGLGEGEFVEFLNVNAKKLEHLSGASEGEGLKTLLSNIGGAISEALNDRETGDPEKLKELQKRIEGVVGTAFVEELGEEFVHLVKTNGWRDGLVIDAIRRGKSIIFDEFPKFKNWTALNSLMAAKQGEEWSFGVGNQKIIINGSRIYFTGNIGGKYRGFNTDPSVVSRAAERVIEVTEAPLEEKLDIALVALSDADCKFLRTWEDQVKLFILLKDIFPALEKEARENTSTPIVPISYRTLISLTEQLVIKKDPKTGHPVYRPTTKTFDEAVLDTLVNAYALYEKSPMPKQIVSLCLTKGLLMDPKVEERVIQILGENGAESYKTAVAAFNKTEEGTPDMFEDAFEQIKKQYQKASFTVNRDY